MNKLDIYYYRIKNEPFLSYLENVFSLYINNDITENDIDFFLEKKDISLPSDFYSLSPEEKKKYLQYEIYIINPVTFEVETYANFSNYYYYLLVNRGKKNRQITNELINYCIALDQRPLYFLTMQNIKIQQIEFFTIDNPEVIKYANSKQITTLYELLMEVYRDKKKDDIKEIVTEYFMTDEVPHLFFCLDYFPNEFALYIELLLYSLGDNTLANKLRLIFQIYSPEYLKIKPQTQDVSIIKKAKKKFQEINISAIQNYMHEHQSDIETMSPNGYQAFYYVFLCQE